MSGEVRSEEPAGGAALDEGTYEIVRDRLVDQARELGGRAEALNRQRLELFGGSALEVIGSERIRTENNCVPRDIVPVGRDLLFGYNVFIGLRTETRVGDVFSLHRFESGEDGFAFPTAPVGSGTPIEDPAFVRDFAELFHYYRTSELTQLRVVGGKLLAVFQTGAAQSDVKVFRWDTTAEGGARYIDNRGERDHVFPASHDFEWQETQRDHHVDGRHPHVSILDEVFVETLNGTLTIKIENNTEDGQGVFSEPVEDPNQSLEDAEIRYAKVGGLILISVLPYRESKRRHLIYNPLVREVARIDAVGHACIELPEDHGIIFPGGYYLQTGETKSFDGAVEGMEFSRRIRSPNGEDVLYVFYERSEGRRILLPYNTIRKEVQNPIHCHGYSLFEDGRMVVFRDQDGEATRVHTMQVWQTPFTSDEIAAQAPSTGSYLETVGNPELVRAISDAFSLRRAIERQKPSRAVYESVIATVTRMLDEYHWIDREEVGDLADGLDAIRSTAELIIDEFEKVEVLRGEAAQVLVASERSLAELLNGLRPDEWDSVDAFVAALASLRRKRGELISLRERRYIDLAAIDALEARVGGEFDRLSERTVGYLLGDEALAPYRARIEACVDQLPQVDTASEALPLVEALETASGELDVLTEILGTLRIEDATQRTRILEEISDVFAAMNRARAQVEGRRKELFSTEGQAEFGAQFKLFGQAVTSALGLADSPERCEEQLGRLLIQLEELEGRFGEFDVFLDELTTKREDVYEAFSGRKQALLEERQRHSEQTLRAAERVLDGIVRRAKGIADPDELNAYFASDPMVLKLRDQVDHLRELEDAVRADELESRLKSAREEASRSLRDRQDIYEDGSAVIVLGRHRFSVNTQPLDVTVVPRDDGMAIHLTGSDYAELIEDESFEQTRPFWSQVLVSETSDVYRGEYLAACLLHDAESGREGLSLGALQQAAPSPEALLEIVRGYAAGRYEEGYERGIHDEDAARILSRLLALHTGAGLLRFGSGPRSLAALFWASFPDRARRELLERRAQSIGRLRQAFPGSAGEGVLAGELAGEIAAFASDHALGFDLEDARVAGRYLCEELARAAGDFVLSAEAQELGSRFEQHLESVGQRRDFEEDLRILESQLRGRHELARGWIEAFLAEPGNQRLAPALDETATLLVTRRSLRRAPSDAHVTVRAEGLLGQHPRLTNGALELRLDEFLERLDRFRRERVPGFRAYHAARTTLLESARSRLRLSEFKPRVMSAFVRNQLIDRVYLPFIGDNLAKQMGALGDAKRTDNMGLLLLVSPPGYGKTTLMEYVADRLGLAFVKVNGPALGHGVDSLDPAAAPNAAARQEVEKINLAFEMGNNVLLYLDDIQHTSAELLQKFISLCDGQRRVEGVWHGKTRTYDLRGKRFAICMAGNPYTESGEKFQIPDMLANRADIYNLGDILSGREDLFALSYLENCLTSNPVLSPLTTRSLEDVAVLARMARGDPARADELSHPYSSVELEEIVSVLRKLLRVQQVLLAVNGEYIRSASMDDAFRREPAFKLQGSYRNMNKLAEKIVPVMNEDELEALIDDHYQGEAQTLTTGAEHNLLKLAELRGRLDGAERARWQQIVREYQRIKSLGGAEDDPATRVTSQLSKLDEHLVDLGGTILEAAGREAPLDAEALSQAFAPLVERLGEQIAAARTAVAAVEAAPTAPAADLSQPLGLVAQRLAEIGDSIALAGGSGAVSEGLGPALEQLARQLSSSSPAPAGPDASLAPYLDRLDATLEAVVSAPRGSEVIQVLSPGVKELIDRMILSIGETQLPLLRGIEKHARLGDEDHRLRSLMNRTLKNFDQLKDLLEALRKIDTRELLRRSQSRTAGNADSTDSADPTEA